MAAQPINEAGKDRRKFDEETIRAILDVMKDHALWVDSDTHRCHHDYITQLLAERQRKLARWDKVREQVTGWAIIAMLGAIGSGVYHIVQSLFKDHAK